MSVKKKSKVVLVGILANGTTVHRTIIEFGGSCYVKSDCFKHKFEAIGFAVAECKKAGLGNYIKEVKVKVK